MSGYMWKRDNNGHAHLEDDVLLAYTRGQLAADVVLIVQQHCAKCTACTQKCAEYTQLGTTLQQSLTSTLPVYPSIVHMLGNALDSPAAASAALQQRNENKKRLRKLRARISGSRPTRLIPAIGVLPLMIIFVSLLVVVGVLAYTSSNNKGLFPATISGRSKTGTPNNAATFPNQPTATSMPVLTRTASTAAPGTTVEGTPGGTATPSSTTKPVIWVCSSNADLAQSRLRICGKNFKMGEKVIVLEVLPNSGRRWALLTTADAYGDISGAWTIPNCRSVPTWVFAYDITRGLTTQLVPVNVSPGGCRSPNVKISGH